MPVVDGREYRAINIDNFKALPIEDGSYIVEGYATTFDDPYDFGRSGLRECIRSVALEGADMSDVIFQYDHQGMVMARQRNNTLVIMPDEHGLYVRADLKGSEQGRQLHTFSVEYRDNAKYFKAGKFQPNADDEYIEEMVRYLGSEHHRVVVDTPELVEALYTSTEARDLPGMADVDSSLLLFCKAVKEAGFKVALSGECADEIFGGYPWYRDPEIRATDGFPWSQSTAYRVSLMRPEYLEGVSAEGYVYDKYLSTIGRVTEQGLTPLEKRMREMMRLNMEWFMQTLLDRKDRMSMYSGLEVRVPFCDYRIVEYLYRVPWEFKDYRGREKGLLRKAAEGLLPEKVITRKKSPYPKTHNPAYETAVRERLREELSQTDCPVLDILDRREVERLMYDGRKVQWYGQLMNDPQIMAYIIQINYWLKLNKVRLV